MALEGLGQWRRLRLPEMRKEASPGQMRARGVPLGWPEVACMLGGVQGPVFIARPSRFAAAGDKNGGEPPLCAAGRRGGGWLAPGANDNHYTVKRGELASCGCLGGAAHGGGGCGHGCAAKRALVAALWGARGGRGGVAVRGIRGVLAAIGQGPERVGTGAGRDAAARAHWRAKRTLWARPEHAHHPFGEMSWPARWLGWS